LLGAVAKELFYKKGGISQKLTKIMQKGFQNSFEGFLMYLNI